MQYMFQSLKIGELLVSNRFVVPPMVVNYCDEQGYATERYIAYHEAKAKGGWGLIITEDYAVDPKGKGFTNIPGLWDDAQIESHAQLTKRIHQYDSKIIAQIYHCGRQTTSLVTGHQPVAPSPIPCPVNQEMPHELTIEEIQEIVEQFGNTALRAKKAGFDGVEVHGAHGYLIAEFMSLYSNKRTDIYGGSLLNRMRFPLEIIANIKAKAGEDFPIIFRISGDEHVPGGRNIEDTKAIAQLLEPAGIHAIHVSAGVYASTEAIIPPAAVPHAWLANDAEAVRKVVSIPVISVGRINDPLVAEAVVASGKADLISMGRASLADPELPKKAAEGKFDEIIYCIGCVQGCVGNLFAGKSVACLANPQTGRETELKIDKVDAPAKVFIAGGGPAGMEAAIVAAKRGHEVHLFEKNAQLGGQLTLAAVPPNKGEITSFVSWQKNQLEKNNVTIHLNTELNDDYILSEKPDAVIIATGAKPVILSLPGVENNHNVLDAHAVLAGKAAVGNKVIVIGGGLVGAETAAHLANHGKQVTIIEQLPAIAQDVEALTRGFLMADLAKNHVQILTNTKALEIKGYGLLISVNGDSLVAGPVDTIVVAVGAISDQSLTGPWPDVNQVITVGDASQVRKAIEAIEEGFRAGLAVKSKSQILV